MTDSQNEFQQSSQGSPEPPYRAQVQQFGQADPSMNAGEQQLAQQQDEAVRGLVQGSADPKADTSGIDASGGIPHTSLYEPIPSSDRTENFAGARMGDTATMPTAATPTVAPDTAGAAGAQAAGTNQGGATGWYAAPSAAQPAQGVLTYESGYASDPAPQPTYTQPQQQTTTSSYASNRYTAQPQAQPAAQKTQPKQKSSGGAGKTFLFGFLGALVACGLAFGVNAALGNNATAPVAAGTAVIGTTDQSIINAADEGQTLAEAVAAKALPSVVAIYNYQNQSSSYGYGFGYGYGVGNQDDSSLVATGMGSGVVISDEGYIITNYHVVEDAAKLTVSVNGVERDATYVGGDSSSDVAVIKVEDTEGLTTADIGDSDNLRIGQWVMTVGAPLGLESSVATGVVSATNRSTIMDSSSSQGDLYSYFYGNATPEYTYYPNMIQTDAVINPGNSGGALVDANGKLIGINAMISSYSGDYAGVGFAIPINYAINIAQTIIEGKEPTHAMIGVSLSQVNSQIAKQYNLSSDTGAYISAITPGTGAADSELQVGDIITKIDGKSVTSTTDVTLEVRAHNVGDTVKLTINRDGEVKDVEVTLTSDENMATSGSTGSQQDQDQDQGEGNGREDGWNGEGNGGRGNGYDMEDIERLFELLGR